ncbi:MAG: trehalose-phosphatase [Acidimicrobiales bacterium]|nr:trehalose-phosphatase [Acidimicrobiales bacterium]
MAPAQIAARISEIARTPILLVASDYDGTLAPLVDDPAAAVPHRESVAALRHLATMPDTHVAVISGRSLRDLATLSRLPAEIHLVGSHGSEFDAGFASALTADQLELRNVISSELAALAATTDGFMTEAKPASIAFHYRNAPAEAGEAAVQQILDGPGSRPGVQVKLGKDVIELTVVATSKGTALDRVRAMVAAEAVVFLGDDVTDEDAFVTLQGPDLGIKVGAGETAATERLADTTATAQFLAQLCEAREAWLLGGNIAPIHEHSLLSDQRAVALVAPDARINWLCLPAPDSPSVFAELLGGRSAGYYAISPLGNGAPISQDYLERSLVLRTRWADVTLTDYLDCSGDRPDEPAGRVNLIRVLEGHGEVEIDFAPRFDYGRSFERHELFEDWLTVFGGNQRLELHAPGVAWDITDEQEFRAVGRVTLTGEPLVLTMLYGADADLERLPESERRKQTLVHWRSWVDRLNLENTVAPKDVRRSALTLKALCHQPTGSVLAAATTSLPEVVGGVRNWDYRHCWPRDAAMSAQALVRLGSTDEAVALLEWLSERVEALPGPEQLRPVYPLVGDAPIPEATLPHLHGYRGSRPVRIGNAAEQQVQLDVFGPIVDLVHEMALAGMTISERQWQLVIAMVQAVEDRWHEPDHGIWEERRPQRHHVHSKVMCWMAVNRALRIGRLTGRSYPDGWELLASIIADDVVEYGWNEKVGAYTIAYGDTELDAAALHLGLSGLLAADDPRFASTIRAIERELRVGPVVYRYRLDDGLPGHEGGFLLCTSWLIEAYVLAGQHDEAEALFKRYRGLLGSTGLLSEEYEPSTNTMLGNHPQAYSHLGLINAALALSLP